MKILNIILKILAGLCMSLFICFMFVVLVVLMFTNDKEWLIFAPIWSRVLLLTAIFIVSSLAIYIDYRSQNLKQM